MDALILLLIMLYGMVVCVIGGLTNSKGLEFVNPIWLYKRYRVNWFGAIFITIIFNMLTLPFSIGYWFYKLCTVGRKN